MTGRLCKEYEMNQSIFTQEMDMPADATSSLSALSSTDLRLAFTAQRCIDKTLSYCRYANHDRIVKTLRDFPSDLLFLALDCLYGVYS